MVNAGDSPADEVSRRSESRMEAGARVNDRWPRYKDKKPARDIYTRNRQTLLRGCDDLIHCSLQGYKAIGKEEASVNKGSLVKRAHRKAIYGGQR